MKKFSTTISVIKYTIRHVLEYFHDFLYLYMYRQLFIEIVVHRGYVRKYFDVQNHTFLCGIMHDFDHFCV